MAPTPGKDKDLAAIEASVAALEKSLAALDGSGNQMSLYNSDGTINRTRLQQVLKGKEYAQWRKENPTLVQNINNVESSLKNEGRSRLAQDALRVGVGLKQQRDARMIDTEMPAYAETPQRSQFLQQALGRTSGLAETGVSPEERSRMTSDADRVYRSQLGGIASGQASAGMANQQAAARQRYGQELQDRSAAYQMAQQERGNLRGLLSQEASETDMIRSHQVSQFANREMPLWQSRNAAAERLMQAGVTNTLQGIDMGFGDLAAIGNTYRQDAPGMVRLNSNANAGANPNSPVAAIYNSPAFSMATGQSALSGMGPTPIAPVPPGQPRSMYLQNPFAPSVLWGPSAPSAPSVPSAPWTRFDPAGILD